MMADGVWLVTHAH